MSASTAAAERPASWKEVLAPYSTARASRAVIEVATSLLPYMALSVIIYLTLGTSIPLTIALMIVVPLAIDLVFIWGPALATVLYSFTNATGAAPIKWVGTENYHTLAQVGGPA